ncbi:MAG TPA: hypothetical protein VFL15_08725 [Gammaproteobacteria bacterium]|nr:hypothetical protein [Gammaproteobacteria bacterium]
MTRAGLSLLVLAGLTPGIAVSAADVPAAATVAAPAATSAPAAAAEETSTAPATLPTRGMDMANVEHIYGAPLQKLPPVPEKGTPKHPPITRWVYPTFVVYFEYNHVVHAVIKAHPFKNNDG